MDPTLFTTVLVLLVTVGIFLYKRWRTREANPPPCPAKQEKLIALEMNIFFKATITPPPIEALCTFFPGSICADIYHFLLTPVFPTDRSFQWLHPKATHRLKFICTRGVLGVTFNNRYRICDFELDRANTFKVIPESFIAWRGVETPFFRESHERWCFDGKYLVIGQHVLMIV